MISGKPEGSREKDRIDGADPSELGAVPHFAAIERPYTRALRADAGYAGLAQHNPFNPSCYETFSGRDEPYSLREPAFVELPLPAPCRKAEILREIVAAIRYPRPPKEVQCLERRCGLVATEPLPLLTPAISV